MTPPPPPWGSTPVPQCSVRTVGAEVVGPCPPLPQGDPVLAPPDPSSPSSNRSSPRTPSPSTPSAAEAEAETPIPPTPPVLPTDTEEHARRLDQLADAKAPVHRSKVDHGKHLRTHIQNLDTYTEPKFHALMDLLINQDGGIDVCILLDAGIREEHAKAKEFDIKRRIGPGYAVFVFPTAREERTAVGGAIVIVHNRLSSRSVSQLSPLGTLIEVKGKIGCQPVAVYGVYSAIDSVEPGSLCMKVKSRLQPDDGTVHEQLRGALIESLAHCAAEGRTFVLGGDFNDTLRPESDPHDFMDVMDGLRMRNSETTSQRLRPTYSSGGRHTRIDHMFHSPGAKCLGVRLQRPLHFENGHVGLHATYKVDRGPTSRWQYPLRQLTKAQKDFGDPIVVADIQQRFATLVRDMSLPCAARLDKLAKDSVQLVYPYQPRQARNKVRRDWSPESIALEIHLKRVRRLKAILGNRPAITDGQYRRALRFSTEGLNKLARGPEQLEIFEGLTVYNSSFWDGVRGDEVRMFLAGAQAELSAKLTVGMRRDRRKRFLLSIQKKNYDLQLGKLKGAVLATLGAKKKSFKLESLKDGDSTILSPGNIHAIVQRYMTEWFAFPVDGSSPPDWETLLQDEHQFTA